MQTCYICVVCQKFPHWPFLSCPADKGAISPAIVCIKDDSDKRFEEDLRKAVHQSLGTSMLFFNCCFLSLFTISCLGP